MKNCCSAETPLTARMKASGIRKCFTVSGSTFSTQPGRVTLQLLPAWYTFNAGGQVSFGFSLNNQGRVAPDSGFDNLVTVSGTNMLTLL